jgi:hypothetical protein
MYYIDISDYALLYYIDLPKKNSYFDDVVQVVQCIGLLNFLILLVSQFLSAFAKLRKATVSFVMPTCPSARNNSAPTGRILMILDI